MQQICRTCECDFCGPATCVGSNLCPDCEFADLSHRWKHAPGGMFPGERTCLLTLQQEEIERLTAIVEKLPKTADGVPVVPGMEVWVWQDGELLCVHATSFDCVTGDWWLRYGMYDWCISDDCYSTKETAEAAKGKT